MASKVAKISPHRQELLGLVYLEMAWLYSVLSIEISILYSITAAVENTAAAIASVTDCFPGPGLVHIVRTAPMLILA